MNTFFHSRYTTLFAYVLFTSVLFFYAFSVFAGTNVELIIQGCNNNNICEVNIGEDVNNCSNDCFPTPTPTPTPTSTPITSPTAPSGTSSGSGSTGYVYPRIEDITVVPDLTSATISWRTSRVSVGTLSIGTTLQYEKGMISETLYAFNHSVRIENLTPNTTYYFKIGAQDTLKHTDEVRDQSFKTLTPPDIEGPANVRNLLIFQNQDTLQLSWTNPTTPDFNSIRVIRSIYSFPIDPFDGKTIYEGRGNYVTDTTIEPNTLYYYTVFTKDFNNNYSSGSIISFTTSKKITPVQNTTGTSSEQNPLQNTPLVMPTPSATTQDIFSNLPLSENPYTIDISNMSVTQNNEKITAETGTFTIDGAKETTISIPTPVIQPPVKNIVLIITDSHNNNARSTFLLTLNKKKTAYETTIDSFGQTGTYHFTIKVVNDRQKIDSTLNSSFTVPFTTAATPLATPNPLQKSISMSLKSYLLIVLFLIIVLLLILFKKRG